MALKTQSKGKEEDLEGIVGDVVSKLIEEEEKAEKLKKLDSINKWFYRDPQGIVQGNDYIFGNKKSTFMHLFIYFCIPSST